ncbi:MAG: hypothetical protein ABFR62_13925, partial [Bacteroidota bacterium]
MIKKITIEKWIIIILFFSINTGFLHAQQQDRIHQVKTKLESLEVDTPGLSENVEVSVSNTALPGFLQAIAHANNVNLNVNPELEQYTITNNFHNATVADVLLFVCKEYDLDIDFTGNILSIYKYKEVKSLKLHREIPIQYDAKKDLVSVDLEKDTLYVAFKQIMDKTGKNLVFSQGLGNKVISGYIQNMPIDGALDKIAFANNLSVTKTRDNYYLFEQSEDYPVVSNDKNGKNKTTPKKPQRKRKSSFYFQVLDTVKHTLNVDFENTPISNIIYDIGLDLKLNMFTSSPLDKAGIASVKANDITFDLLLNKILENTEFTYKKEGNIYYFGDKKQITLRNSVMVPLLHRSIEVMNAGTGGQRKTGRTFNYSGGGSRYFDNNFNSQQNNRNLNNERTQNRTNTTADNSKADALINIIPEDIVKDLEIKTDIELNSFIVSGPSQNIKRFKDFINYIDKPVPVILIEVMVIEVSKTATIETGISAGIGDAPTTTEGEVFPKLDMNIGANTINKVIGGFSGFGSYNLGQVVPNFYLQLKAMESNGNIKIRSSPKLSTLNGHRANLSIGETTYYAVRERNIYGSQNPQTSEITNYLPVDAEFALNIKPLVSGDGQITLDINVIQSTFNGIKVADDAPPGMNSREFNSIIRVK